MYYNTSTTGIINLNSYIMTKCKQCGKYFEATYAFKYDEFHSFMCANRWNKEAMREEEIENTE